MITFKDGGGIASHKIILVFQDGERLGSIRFIGRGGWRIADCYGEPMAHRKTLDDARETAAKLTFPSRQQAYEKHRDEAYRIRLLHAERSHGNELARLTRVLMEGSNSARAELEELLTQIEAEAREGRMSYSGFSFVPNYPRPPGEERIGHFDFDGKLHEWKAAETTE